HRAASYYANMQEQYDEGVEDGFEDEFEQGIDAEKIGTMRRMIKANLTDDMLAIAPEFTVEQVAIYRSQFQSEGGWIGCLILNENQNQTSSKGLGNIWRLEIRRTLFASVL
ncbi:TPA: hypothetical protein ACGO2G_002181, partial [Streptococcus suis]